MKQLLGTDIGSYTFAPGIAGAGTVTITGVSALTLEQVLLITNVTDQVIIYNFSDSLKGATIASNVITLELDTSTMSAADDLQIWLDLPVNDLAPLPVSIPPPSAPPGATAVTQAVQSTLAGDSIVDTLYTITNTKTLTINFFEGGGTNDNKIELFEDPNGDLSVLNIISVMYLDKSSQQFSLNQDFVGDGTRRILLRRTNLKGGSEELFGKWTGFEQ